MKFELSKKFNVKGLIGVSAVALAMIGAGGAINANNVHAHAESDADALLNSPTEKKIEREENQSDNKAEHEADEQNEPYRKQLAKSEMTDGDLDPELAHDPTIRHYLAHHGYTNHQINKAKNVNLSNGNAAGGDNNEDNRLARKAINSDKSLARHHNADVTIGGGSHTHKATMPATSSHGNIRRHLSRHTIKGIESTVSKDERAIKRDEKKLNTKSGREFSKNMSYYKDLQSRKASLRRVVRSHHASKRAKRHARKLLRSLNKKAPRQKKMAKKVIAYYVHTSEDMNSAKANLKKIAKAKRTPKNVKKSIKKFLNSLNKKATKRA